MGNSQKICKEGRLGTNCDFRCLCEIPNCQADGSCKGDLRCRSDFFGQLCQYVDLAVKAIAGKGFATDHDLRTCNTNRTGNTLALAFKENILLTFLAVEFEEFPQVTLKYRRNNIIPTFKMQGEVITCYAQELWEVTAQYVEIRCANQFFFDQVVLTGTGVGYLCNFYISGGRNVARSAFPPKNQHSSTSDVLSISDYVLTVDGGIRQVNCPTYSDSSADNVKWTWQSSPGQSYLVHRLVFYVASDLESELLGLRAEATFLDASVHAVLNLTSLEGNRFQMAMALPSVVRSISLRSTKAPSVDGRYVLSVCEMKVYGDCSAGGYGLDCTSNCSHCAGKRCLLNGDCVECNQEHGAVVCRRPCSHCVDKNSCEPDACKSACENGYKGPRCVELCSNCGGSGVCAKDTGECQAGCMVGFYSTSCHKKCWNCAGDGSCSRKNGHCNFGCTDGYRGDACFLSCGRCAGNGSCDRNSGRCFSGCQPSYMGEDCVQECNRCANRTCPDVNGQCISGCTAGYFGKGCEKDCANCAGNKQCNITTGVCTHGCSDGLYGEKCDVECRNCGGNGTCNRNSGNCDGGCDEGFLGDMCDVHENDVSSFDIQTFIGYAGFVLLCAAALLGIFFARDYCGMCKLPSRRSLELLKKPPTTTDSLTVESLPGERDNESFSSSGSMSYGSELSNNSNTITTTGQNIVTGK